MAKNRIIYQTRALKQLRKMPEQKEIRAKIKVLEDMPNCFQVKALVNHIYQYRLRVGSYRVFFNFDGVISIISVEEVKNEMNGRTKYQIIKDVEGKPAFVLVPYDEFQKIMFPVDLENGVPNEVVDLAFEHNRSALWAWREYLELTQQELAEKLGITQAAYSQHENKPSLRKPMREKMAAALGINATQLDF